jgi:hypothetical protein
MANTVFRREFVIRTTYPERDYPGNLRTWTYNLTIRLPLPFQYTGFPSSDWQRAPEPERPANLRTWTHFNLNLQTPPAPAVNYTGLPSSDWQPAPAYEYSVSLRFWTQNPTTLRVPLALPPGDQYTDRPGGVLARLRLPLRSWTWQYNLNLIGQDKFPAGEQITDRPPLGPLQPLRSWTVNLLQSTLAPTTGLPPGEAIYDRPQLGSPPSSQLYAWSWNYNRNLIGQDALVTGEQITDLPPRAYPEPATRTWLWSYNLNLIGKDRLPVGEAIYDRPQLLPVVSSQLYAWSWNYNRNLIGQDQFPPGDRLFDRPPDPLGRGQTWIGPPVQAVTTAPFSQDDWPLPKIAPQPDRTWTWSYNLNLIGQDALPVGEQFTALPPRDPREGRSWTLSLLQSTLTPLPIGEAIYDLPPRAAAPSSQLYAWSWRYNPNLIGQDQLPVGEQRTELPQRGPAQPDRTWISALNLALASGPVPLPFNQDDWPLPKIAAQPDRTWTWSYNLNLIGKDQLPVGRQITDLPPRDPREGRTWISALNLALAAGPAALPFNQDDWPLPKIAAQPDRTWVWSYNLNLIGKDQLPVGRQFTDLPPRDPREARTWIQAVNLALTAGQAALPFNQSDWPIGRGPLQPDRTWINTFNLNLIGKDQLPAGARVTDLPPRAYPEPATRTWAWWYNLNLVGQDRLPTGTQFFERPPLGPQQPDRTWIAYFNLNLTGQDRLPFRQQDWPIQQPIYPTSLRTWISSVNVALVSGPAQALPFNQYDWPLPKIAAQPDRHFSAFYNRNLIGKDKFPPGARITDLPPIGPYYPDALRFFAVSPAVPPVIVPPVTEHHDMPFFASMGQLKSW